MTKVLKRSLLFSIVLFSLLIISCSYTSLIPLAYAEEETTQEKALNFLSNVVGMDIESYKIKIEEFSQGCYLSAAPEERLDYTFRKGGHILDVETRFTNKKLRTIRIQGHDGTPSSLAPVDDVIYGTKDFLSRYANYSGSSIFIVLRDMLDLVDIVENTTKTTNAAILKVTVTQDYSTTFRWTCAVNGVPSPSKCIALHYENGVLNYFVDHWSVYNIGSTEINVSKEEAVEIALNAAKDYSWKVGAGKDTMIEVKEFEISRVSNKELVFGNEFPQADARNGDPLTTYPLWDIKLDLDKVYSGNVYGINVRIWADTKEVFQVKTLSYLGVSPSDNSSVESEPTTEPQHTEYIISEMDTNQLLIQLIASLFLFSVLIVIHKICFRKKRITPKLKNVLNSKYLLLNVLLCFLFTLLLSSISMIPAKAYSIPQPTGKAITYGISHRSKHQSVH